jgi:hypothetical protein
MRGTKPPELTMTWSKTSSSSSRPASTITRVTATSSGLGADSPLGRLCATMMRTVFARTASRNARPVRISEVFTDPCGASSLRTGRVRESCRTTRRCSFSVRARSCRQPATPWGPVNTGRVPLPQASCVCERGRNPERGGPRPIPCTRRSSSNQIRHRPARPLADATTSSARRGALVSRIPDPRRMATSSAAGSCSVPAGRWPVSRSLLDSQRRDAIAREPLVPLPLRHTHIPNGRVSLPGWRRVHAARVLQPRML